MLLTSARVVPQAMRARLVSFFGVMTTLPSFTTVSTSLLSAIFRVPSLPLVVSTPPARSTVTPCGMLTGSFPIRDMMKPLEHAAEDLAADIGGTRLGVRHDPARRRQDRNAETVIDTRQIGDARIDAPARLRDARDLADHRLAIDIFQLDLELGHARSVIRARVAADVTLALQDFEHIGADLRGRRVHDRLVRGLAVPDPCQHIPEGIAHRHSAISLTSST